MYVHMSVHVYVHMYIHIRVHMYVHIRVHMYDNDVTFFWGGGSPPLNIFLRCSLFAIGFIRQSNLALK